MGGAILLPCKCCGEYCTPLCLSITSAVLTVISIALSISIMVFIPWGDEELKLPGKLIFFITFGLEVIILILLGILIYLRCAKLINTSKNSLAKILSVLLAVINVLAIIGMIVSLVLISRNMDKRHNRVYPEVYNPIDYSYDQPGLGSDSKMLAQIIISLIIIVLLVITIVFNGFIRKMVFLKSDLSYKDQKIERHNTSDVKIIHNIPSNKLQFTGYDQEGKRTFIYVEPNSEANNMTNNGLNTVPNIGTNILPSNGIDNLPNIIQNKEQNNILNNVPNA